MEATTTNREATFKDAEDLMRTALQSWRAAGFTVLAGNRKDGATVIVLPEVQVEMQPDQSFVFTQLRKG